jgi:hypothetical protein
MAAFVWGFLVSVRKTGLSPNEMFLAAAGAGIAIESGLGAGFSLVALAALSGAVAWVYGSILVLPIKSQVPRRSLTTRVVVAVIPIVLGSVLGGFLGLGIPSAFHL